MFALFEPNVKAVIAFLRLLNVKVAGATVNETMQAHPDWPDPLCVYDTLQKWNIPTAAGSISTNKIQNLPTPFIAITTNRNSPLAIVKHVTNDNVSFFQDNYHKTKTVSCTSIFKHQNYKLLFRYIWNYQNFC